MLQPMPGFWNAFGSLWLQHYRSAYAHRRGALRPGAYTGFSNANSRNCTTAADIFAIL
jgi:hypothetical protein